MNYIVFPEDLDIRRGGPSGYIANLERGITDLKNKTNIEIISSSQGLKSIDEKSNFKRFAEKFIGKSKLLTESYYLYKFLRKDRMANINEKLSSVTFESNDIIHVHSVLDYYSLSKKGILGKIVLTPHTPESIATEITNMIRLKFNSNMELNKLLGKIKKVERYAFQECEYFIFPSKEAMSIYSEFVEGFDEYINNKKVYFNLTGCNKLKSKLDKIEFRKRYNIPEKAFLISYVGRHSKIKGYDILLDVANELKRIDPNIYIVTAGSGGIRSNSENQNLIEIGWTDDPGSVINSSDLFLLPNRNTYFDLALLEVLSIGTPVLASRTGGNISVGKLTNGIRLFENGNIDEIIRIILSLKDNPELLGGMKADNIRCYNENFTITKFAERYLKILQEISSI